MKAVKRFINNLALRNKLLVFFLLASVIPLLAISLYFYQVFQNQLVSQTHDRMRTMNSQLSSNIDNKLKNYEQISSLLYMDSELRDWLTREYRRGIDFVHAYDYINSLLFGIQLTNTDIDSITIYPFNESIPSDGMFIQRVDEGMREAKWYKELEQSYGNAVYSVVMENGGKQPVITLARLLNNNDMQRPYGVLAIHVKESALYSLFGEEAQASDIYLVNGEGAILSTRDKSMILQPFRQVLEEGGWSAGGSGTFERPVKGMESLVVYDTLPIGWKTVSIIPLSDVLSEANKASSRILLIAAISILLSVGLIAMTARYFSNRFQTLTRFVRKVGDEQFQFELKQDSKDEIGLLAESFNTMKRQLDKLINEVYKKEIMRKETELALLQSQINPHFLYNTLAVISSLAVQNQDRQVSKIVRHLSNFYKTSLSKGKPVILIQKEIEITRHYVEIQSVRFDNLFRVHWQLDEELFRHQTVKLILQPFVENAIQHAVWSDDEPLNIVIRLYRLGDAIVFEVVDDGAGMSPERAADIMRRDKEAGYGIGNVHERIQLAYGPEYGVTLFSRPGIGTQVVITCPLQ
ncbi:sensor histidine kinase [Paenibacillus sp. PAMC21692]|uniref:cache domain-containing sensor histidine kinase n=1 Tax=Paenibacillus sp. PAMC21692 TaxID=2762320 RepID=UPI00164E599D|nr:sensor histidine kinase [Paenibacillus sp. PAMC21692]QNK57777.1 sensor histidine kinase [Paenibacillus sp. PAMC21692]